MVRILELTFELFLVLKKVHKQMELHLVEIVFRKLLLSFFRYSDNGIAILNDRLILLCECFYGMKL